ncbi:MAG: hypothetical protein EPO40_24240 [Myxococcaceae bacterium]|nr:MAG: hypothetical protein EPO40_24240 [Myxococcaceae bacterium]
MSTIKVLAKELKVPLIWVKAFLRLNGPAAAIEYRSPDRKLSAAEEGMVREAHEQGELRMSHAGSDDADEAVASEVEVDDATDLPVAERLLDLPTSIGAGAREVLVHQEVLEWVACDRPHSVRQSLTRALGEMLERGWAKNSKGVKGTNAGWRRVPFGGSNGMQFYLWYCDGGSKPARGMVPSRTVLVRAVRHHDETSRVIDAGSIADYAPVSPRDVLAAEAGSEWADPLSPTQRRAVSEQGGAIILQGHPGAGKTTSLQHMLPLLSGRVLYLTFSRALLDRTKNWWEAFSSPTTEVRFETFDDFVTAWSDEPSVDRFREQSFVDELHRLAQPCGASLGPWLREGALSSRELYAELHAYVFGSALPVAFRGRGACVSPQLSEHDYITLRRDALGEAGARGAYRASTRLDPFTATRLFPAPARAFAALTRIANEGLPEALSSFDAIVVDEIQDLTVTEVFLLIEVAVRVARASGRRPRLVVAGDESQTVRPTGFEWAVLGDLVYQRLGEKAEHVLPGNVRSPADLAAVVNNSWRLVYGRLDKGQRPRGVAVAESDESTVGRILRVCADSPAAREAVLASFAGATGAALVVAGHEVPAEWREPARRLGIEILTADAVKGLDFPVVGFLEAGATIAAQVEQAGHKLDRLNTEFARMSGDRIRVALSRPTGTLVLIDRACTVAIQSVVDALCLGTDGEPLGGDMGTVPIDELPELLDADASDAVEAVLLEMEVAETLLERDPESARMRLLRSRGRLGKAGQAGALGAEHRLRFFGLLAIAAVVTALLPELSPKEAHDRIATANRLFRDAGRPAAAEAVKLLARRLGADGKELDAQQLRDLLEFAKAVPRAVVDEPRLRGSFERSALREARAIANGPLPEKKVALDRVVDVLIELHDTLAGTFPEMTDIRNRGVERVFEHALERGIWPVAERAIEVMGGRVSNPERAGRMLEMRGAQGEAAGFYVSVGRHDDAIRCLRDSGETPRALELARSFDHPLAAILEWTLELTRLVAQRPEGELVLAERHALRAGLEGLL